MNWKNTKEYWADFDWRDFKDLIGYTFCYDLFWNIKDGLCNIITWWPVIWRDRWWDSSFFYTIMYKKLELIEYEFRVNSHIMHGPRYARRMKICMKLIKRIQAEEYGEYPVDLQAQMTETPAETHPEFGQLTRLDFNITPKQDYLIKQYWARYSKDFNKDQDVLFRILRKNLQSFWD